jgi:hypothetical protein
MQGAPGEPFDPCSRGLERHMSSYLGDLACRFSLMSSRLEQMLMGDQFDVTVFGVHFGSGVARVPGCVSCLPPSGVLVCLVML